MAELGFKSSILAAELTVSSLEKPKDYLKRNELV